MSTGLRACCVSLGLVSGLIGRQISAQTLSKDLGIPAGFCLILDTLSTHSLDPMKRNTLFIMKKKNKGLPISGWLNFNKPCGISSNQAVQVVKQVLTPAKIGHSGTLDPLASGVLPLALGEATKTVSYAMDATKTYVATITFGAATSTDDKEGNVIAESNVRPTTILLKKALLDFSGCTISQRPPAYSAIKLNGRRAYELARIGKEVVLNTRDVWLGTASLRTFDGETAHIQLSVGKGFYVRSFARDLGEKLRTRAHLSDLQRTRVGPFTLEDAISLDSLTALDHSSAVATLLPIERVLDDIPVLDLNQAEAWRLKMGFPVALVRQSFLANLAGLSDGQTVRARLGSRLIALCEYRKARLKVMRGFH